MDLRWTWAYSGETWYFPRLNYYWIEVLDGWMTWLNDVVVSLQDRCKVPPLGIRGNHAGKGDKIMVTFQDPTGHRCKGGFQNWW